jgi:hypothetical protein
MEMEMEMEFGIEAYGLIPNRERKGIVCKKEVQGSSR